LLPKKLDEKEARYMKAQISSKIYRLGYLVLLFLIVFFLHSAVAVQELEVGYIEGRGDDADVAVKAFETATIEYEVIGEDDYNVARLFSFDVIGVGVDAYGKNEALKANFKVVNEYVKSGGYLVTLDFQQDSTWQKKFLPYPLTLFDDDLEEDAGVEIIDHPIWKTPNRITEEHFIGWGGGDFMSDGPHEAKPPWKTLLISNNWPLVVVAKAGSGDVVFNSLQVLQALGRTGNDKIVEVMENFLFWRGAFAVHAEGKMTTIWSQLKGTHF